MSEQITNSFRRIAELSNAAFDNTSSLEELEKLDTFVNNVHDMDLEFNALSIQSRIDEQTARLLNFADLGGVELKLSSKAESDFLSKSKAKIDIAHLRKYGSMQHPETQSSIAEIMFNAALAQPKSSGYKGIIHGGVLRSLVGSAYPTVAQTGISPHGLAMGVLDVLSHEDNSRPVIEGVEPTAPLVEARFNEESGDVYIKIVYDQITNAEQVLGIPNGSGFAMGIELRDNLYGSGKMTAAFFLLNKDCNNGMSSRENLAGLVVNHTSISNMLSPKSRTGILDLLERSYGNSHDPVEMSIIARLRAIMHNPKKAFEKVKTVIDPEWQQQFYHMLGVAVLQYADQQRVMNMDVIRKAATIGVADVQKELSKLTTAKLLSKRDADTVLMVLEEDDTIDQSLRGTAYGLGAALTRTANMYRGNSDKLYNSLQELGRNVIEVLPTANLDKRKDTYKTW